MINGLYADKVTAVPVHKLFELIDRDASILPAALSLTGVIPKVK